MSVKFRVYGGNPAKYAVCWLRFYVFRETDWFSSDIGVEPWRNTRPKIQARVSLSSILLRSGRTVPTYVSVTYIPVYKTFSHRGVESNQKRSLTCRNRLTRSVDKNNYSQFLNNQYRNYLTVVSSSDTRILVNVGCSIEEHFYQLLYKYLSFSKIIAQISNSVVGILA